MDLIDDDQADLLDVASGLPATTDTVPLLGGGDDDVCIADSASVRCVVTSQLDELEAHLLGKSPTPVLHTLANKGFHGRDVDDLATRLLAESPPHSQLCSDSLTGSSRRTKQHIGIGVVHAVEELSLHRVEELEPRSIDLLEQRVLERLDWQWLEVQEIRVDTFGVWANQVLEAHRRHSLCA